MTVAGAGAAAAEASSIATSFVPALVRAGAEGSAPRAEVFSAILLYVDAAGFSQLTAKLVAEDRRGALEVGRIVNAHFRRLVDLVEAHGGAVQGIAGDALIALWPANSDGAGAVRQALACGHRIATQSERVDDQRLPVRGVVDAGEVWLAHLGGEGERLAVAAGPLLERMSDLSSVWRDGEVVATDAARRLAEGGSATVGGRPARGAGETSIAYVPVPVRALLSEARLEWLSEFRTVSVMFARFSGWRSGAPDALPRLDRLAEGCRAALARHGGALLQFMVDDKGLVLLACWGLPTNTTEDGEARAVRAAEEIIAAAREAGVEAGIGVTTGKAFVGVVGSDGFRHYALVGAVVNDAAFLMRQDCGPIVCCAATRAGAKAIHRFEALGSLLLKGADRPTEIFAPRSPRARGETERVALVGRHDERARIDAALAPPAGGLAWISGEPGIGKSHLADAVRRKLTAAGLPCLSTTVERLDTGLPYAAWRPLIDQLLGDHAKTVTGLARDARLAGIESLAERLPLAAELVGLGDGESAFTDGLPQAARPAETRRLLADLIDALAPPGRFALFLEDVHWLETSSWLLLALLRRRLPRMAVVLTSRRIALDALPEEAAALLRDEDVTRVPLERLDAGEAERLVHQTLGASSVPQEVTRRIFARAEGHPYYTKALATSMLQRGILRSRDGHCYLSAEAAELSEVAFPDTLQGVIAARLSALEPAAQLSLKVASVEGRLFRADQVAALHPDRPARETIEAHLAAARALELVEIGQAPGQFQFHHALTRDTVYDLLVEEQRRVLHAAAAHWHETIGDDTPDLVLAHHWTEAGEARRAIYYLDRAAANAEAAQSPREAADLLRRALQLDATLTEPHPPHIVGDWHRRAGEALFEFGDPRQAVEQLKAAVAQLDRALPQEHSLGPRILAEFCRLKTRPMRHATQDAERARLIAAADILSKLAFLTYELQRHFQAAYCTFRALNLSRRAGGDSAPLAIANINMAMASLTLPFIDGVRHRDDAVAMAERIEDPACSLFVGWNGGSYDTATGHLDDAVENLHRALAAGEVRRSARDLEALQVTLANTYRVLGRHWLGIEDLEAALASARERGNLMYRIWALGQLCRSHILCGNIDAFHRRLGEYRALMTDDDARGTASGFNRVVHQTAEAQARLLDGDADGAIVRVDEALKIALNVAVPQFYFIEVPGALADALIWAWRLEPAMPLGPLAARNARFARRLARFYPAVRPQSTLTRGDLVYLRGRPRRAARVWCAAAKRAAARGLFAQEGQALGRLALPGTGTGADRAHARDAAAACFLRAGGTIPYPLARIIMSSESSVPKGLP